MAIFETFRYWSQSRISRSIRALFHSKLHAFPSFRRDELPTPRGENSKDEIIAPPPSHPPFLPLASCSVYTEVEQPNNKDGLLLTFQNTCSTRSLVERFHEIFMGYPFRFMVSLFVYAVVKHKCRCEFRIHYMSLYFRPSPSSSTNPLRPFRVCPPL